ncbi:hypothetical protein [Embleya sp. NPDC020630]|uniref:hypothetical protein n=1 Tax=Embleya sp. NPDC020630 TaxID=3363979 RepID=UPI0037B59CE9
MNTVQGIKPCAVVEPDRACPDPSFVHDPIPLCRRHAVRVAMRVTDALFAGALAAANTNPTQDRPQAGPPIATIDEPTVEERALEALREAGPEGSGAQALARTLTGQGHYATRRMVREWIAGWTGDGRVVRVVDGEVVSWVHHTHLRTGPRTATPAPAPPTRRVPDGHHAPRPADKPTLALRVLRVLANGPLTKADIAIAVNNDGGPKVSSGSIANNLTTLTAQRRTRSSQRGVYELAD